MVRIYAEKLKEITGEEPFSIDKIIEFNLQLIPEPDPDSSDPLESVKQQLSQFLGPFEDKVAIIRGQYMSFLVKFEEQAANGKLDKAKCVEISTGCILEVLAPSCRLCLRSLTFRDVSCSLSSPRRLVRLLIPSPYPVSIDLYSSARRYWVRSVPQLDPFGLHLAVKLV